MKHDNPHSTPEVSSSAGKRGRKSFGIKGVFFRFIGKNPDGSRKKAIHPSKKRTVFRYVTVALAFLGIAGLAAISYQVPKILSEGGVRIEWLERMFDSERTEEERDYDYSATQENAFAYREKEDGTVAIAGYLGDDKKVVLPRKIGGKTVSEIDAGAFMETNVTSVTMYKDVTAVGANAFSGCTMLFEIIFSENITVIGDAAFYGCSTLKNVTIPDGVTAIGNSTFANCTSLESVTFGAGLTEIGRSAFEGSGLTSLSLPATVKSTGTGAFRNCKKLTSVTLAEGVEVLGDGTFAECTALETVKLSSTLTTLGSNAFEKCAALKEFTGGENVVSIGTGCFREAQMEGKTDFQLILGDGILAKYFGTEENVSIYASVKVIGEGAFEGNTLLKTVNVPVSAIILDRAFRNCTALNQVVLSQGVTSIGKEAFSGCTALSFMELPANLTQLGEGAFAMCTQLKGITLPASLKVVPANAFARCANVIEIKFNGQTEIGPGAFSDCGKVELIVLPNTLTTIGNNAFAGCSRLGDIRMNAGLLSIGEYAFSGVLVRTLNLPNSLTHIGETAFTGCPRLAALYATRGSYAHQWAAAHGL